MGRGVPYGSGAQGRDRSGGCADHPGRVRLRLEGCMSCCSSSGFPSPGPLARRGSRPGLSLSSSWVSSFPVCSRNAVCSAASRSLASERPLGRSRAAAQISDRGRHVPGQRLGDWLHSLPLPLLPYRHRVADCREAAAPSFLRTALSVGFTPSPSSSSAASQIASRVIAAMFRGTRHKSCSPAPFRGCPARAHGDPRHGVFHLRHRQRERRLPEVPIGGNQPARPIA